MRAAAMLLCLLVGAVVAADTGANPIRKVVTLMQNMQKEIAAEGDKEKELFDKFMCFCGGSSSELQQSAANARTSSEQLFSKLKSEKSEKAQLEMDLVQHKKDREGAKNDAAQAATLRAKESAEYKEASADMTTNLAAMAGAIPALEAGMTGASLMQLPHLDRLHHLVETYPNVDANDRRNVIAFLDQSGDYVPQSGQIVGILKQMKDEMDGDLKQTKSEEDQAKASFQELTASKEDEVKLASRAIETKMARSGELAVSVQQTADALQDAKEELADAEQFSGNLGEQCSSKQKVWDGRVMARTAVVAAIGPDIKILNDDSALDTFKKALPSPSALQTGFGFLQRRGGHASSFHKARALLSQVPIRQQDTQFRLMLFSLTAKLKLQKRSGAKAADILEMVDGMLTLLGKQQAEDDHQREHCKSEFNNAEDEEKAAQDNVAEMQATIVEMTDSVAQLVEQIKSLSDEKMALDKAVAEATEQRKEEHNEYLDNVQMNGVAKQLVDKARNRLHKFYNPSLYREPAKPVDPALLQDEKILAAGPSLLEIALKSSARRVAPPQAPETFSGDVKKNSGSTGVVAMMDTIIKDLEMATQEAMLDENTSQKNYNKLMADSQQERAQNSKSATNREVAKAVLGTKLVSMRQSHADANEDLNNAQSYIDTLHGSCDFLLDNYDTRKEARATEMESLKNAKSVLSGASFGL